ncbi:MAG: hypothetical protein F6K55_23620 [Moorea sp. SIO4A3]|nr:hypothetical protein [Moorena sp. SIO4A3]
MRKSSFLIVFASILIHCSQIRCSLFPTTAAKSTRPMRKSSFLIVFASILIHCSQIRCSLFPTTAAKSTILPLL